MKAFPMADGETSEYLLRKKKKNLVSLFSSVK